MKIRANCSRTKRPYHLNSSHLLPKNSFVKFTWELSANWKTTRSNFKASLNKPRMVVSFAGAVSFKKLTKEHKGGDVKMVILQSAQWPASA